MGSLFLKLYLSFDLKLVLLHITVNYVLSKGCYKEEVLNRRTDFWFLLWTNKNCICHTNIRALGSRNTYNANSSALLNVQRRLYAVTQQRFPKGYASWSKILRISWELTEGCFSRKNRKVSVPILLKRKCYYIFDPFLRYKKKQFTYNF